MKRATSLMFVVILLVLLLPMPATAAVDIILNDETGIPDPVLYELALETGDKNGDRLLTRQEAATIEYIGSERESLDIVSLKGIIHLSGLTSIHIYGDELRDISEIGMITNLKYLAIGGKNLMSFIGIEKLINLQTLYIDASENADLSQLKIPDSVVYLSLQMKLKGLNEVKFPNGVKNLEVIYNSLESLDGIEQLVNLETLFIRDNKLPNLDGIEKLSKLIKIYAFNNQLTDISAVENLTKLTTLAVQDNYLITLPDLSRLVNLVPYESHIIYTDFSGNYLSEEELRNKLPSHLVDEPILFPSWYYSTETNWLTRQIESQNEGFPPGYVPPESSQPESSNIIPSSAIPDQSSSATGNTEKEDISPAAYVLAGLITAAAVTLIVIVFRRRKKQII